ncbi:MAG: hypothetical protein IJR28_00515, partial [Ottowia sp.]|nr:hypothetical protein [Ottowia sp.]
MDTFWERHPGAVLDAAELINVAVILDKTSHHEDARNLFQAIEERMEREGASAWHRGELYGARAAVEIDAGNWERA